MALLGANGEVKDSKSTVDVLKREILLSSAAMDDTGHSDKENIEMVFAYQMRDQISVRGVVNVQKDFDTWLQRYITGKIAAEAKAIRDRIEQKKWNTVLELQKKFKYTYEQATAQVFGKPLVEQPATVQKTA